MSGMLCIKYSIVFSLENSFHIVLSGEVVSSPLVQALYLTRQHYRRTVPLGVDNNRIIIKQSIKVHETQMNHQGHNVSNTGVIKATMLVTMWGH
jgi:hypothetical protein